VEHDGAHAHRAPTGFCVNLHNAATIMSTNRIHRVGSQQSRPCRAFHSATPHGHRSRHNPHRILVFGPDFASRRTIGVEGEMQTPSGLAIDDRRKRINVCEQLTACVQVFERIDGSGRELARPFRPPIANPVDTPARPKI
jgi:hypothetical protein